MNNNLTIDEIRKLNRKRKELRKEAYRKVFQLCLHKIKLVAKTGFEHLYFELPLVVSGYPYYDINECIEYISKKLTNLELRHRLMDKNHIYIEWKDESD